MGHARGTSKSIAIIGNQGFSMLNFRGPLIEDLVARGHRVFALAPQMDADTKLALKNLGAEPIEIGLSRTGINPLADLATLFSLRRLLKKLRPDVTLGYAAKPAIYGTLAGWMAGIPRRFAMIEGLGYVFSAHVEKQITKIILGKIVTVLFRVALRHAEKVFFLNPDDVADCIALRIVAKHQVINIGGIGVDLQIWQPVAPVVDPVTFIFVGRLLRDKGVLNFVAAAREVKARFPRARFLLVGGIDENPTSISQTQVESWVAEGLIEWPGHVAVGPWMKQASVFVLPSLYREGVPRSTQEAMAMARPVITTDSIGCRETVVEGVNGFLIPARSVSALVEAMQKFIEQPALIASMGTASRAHAEEKFDVRKVDATLISAMGL